jgi:Bacterial Ig domain
MKQILFLITLALLLIACSKLDTTPPALAITNPTIGSAVSGTVAVTVGAVDDTVNISRVDLYVRGKGSTDKGMMMGSSASKQSPYVISWNSEAQPNQAELELVAVGKDASGNESESPAVSVKTQNQGPNLQLLTAYTVFPDSSSSLQSASLVLSDFVSPQDVLPPSNFSFDTPEIEVTSLDLQATSASYLLEWLWDPYATAATGNGIYVSDKDLAGPYDLVTKRATSVASGLQKYSKTILDAASGDSFYGLVTGIDASQKETGYSNADKTTFLPAQSLSTPSSGATLLDGRPTLNWVANTKADGYLYYVYDKNPWEADAKILWSNPIVNGKRQSIEELTVTYPFDQAALGSGTYWWWVVGISFDRSSSKVDAMSFSKTQTFKVP